jgi:hypothetical protein
MRLPPLRTAAASDTEEARPATTSTPTNSANSVLWLRHALPAAQSLIGTRCYYEAVGKSTSRRQVRLRPENSRVCADLLRSRILGSERGVLPRSTASARTPARERTHPSPRVRSLKNSHCVLPLSVRRVPLRKLRRRPSSDSVVRGVRSAATQLSFVALVDEDCRPTARAGVPGARAVAVEKDVLHAVRSNPMLGSASERCEVRCDRASEVRCNTEG